MVATVPKIVRERSRAEIVALQCILKIFVWLLPYAETVEAHTGPKVENTSLGLLVAGFLAKNS